MYGKVIGIVAIVQPMEPDPENEFRSVPGGLPVLVDATRLLVPVTIGRRLVAAEAKKGFGIEWEATCMDT